MFITWLIIFTWLIKKNKLVLKSGLKRRFLISVFFLKAVAGIILTLLYTYYYSDRDTADIYKYYDDGQVIYSALQEDPVLYVELISGINEEDKRLEPYLNKMKNWTALSEPWLRFTHTSDYNFFNSNRIITRFNALIMPVSGGFIYTHILFMCFLSLLGFVAIYNLIKEHTVPARLETIGVIFFLPSLIFWCSGVLKDAFVLAMLCFLINKIFLLNRSFSFRKKMIDWLIILFSGICVVLTKYYVLVACIPSLISRLISFYLFRKVNPMRIYISVHALIFLLAIMHAEMTPGTNIFKVLTNKREEALKTAIWGDAKHLVFDDTVEPEISEIVFKIPESLLNSLFRPQLFEADDWILIPPALENLVIFIFLFLMLRKARFERKPPEIFWFFFFFSLSLACIIGFTTPVLGGIVRYKTAFLPFLLLALIMLTGRKKILSFKNQDRFIFNS